MRRIALVLLLVAFGSTGSAQTGTGSIRGTVTRPEGPVPAAPVRAKHQSTGRILEDICTENNKFPEYAGVK